MIGSGKLTKIDASTFSGLIELREIEVSWNRIESIHPDLVHLEFFYRAYNKLKIVDGRLLRDNPNIQYMTIDSNNRLEAIARNFFDTH